MYKAWVDETWGKYEMNMRAAALRSEGKLPYSAKDGVFDNWADLPKMWTNGFWPGIMWLLYAETKDDLYKNTARQAQKLLDKAFEDYDGHNHDLGFMWDLSAGADYRLTGNKNARRTALYAANVLNGRYNIKGDFIRAWPEEIGWSIIDCMMNLPLLYFASREVGDPCFKYVGMAHADMTMRDHVRPDGSVAHIVSHDPVTGEVIETLGGQGIETGSSWSRGQAWAVYGFILSYIHTGKQEYLDTAKKTAHYFIANITEDYLPRCDFRAPAEPVIYDSTAGACAACGLIEIAKHVPEYEKDMYLRPAIKMLRAMDEKFCDWDESRDGVLQMGTEEYKRPEGRHKYIIYGDYFFLEALYKLRGNDILFW